MREYLRLIRLPNCLFSGIASLVGARIAEASVNPGLFIVPFSVCAAGMIFNDLCDIEDDRWKGRPLATGKISPAKARVLFYLFSLGILCSPSPAHFVFALLIYILLLIYSAKMRDKKYFGNFVVAFATASTFLFGALGGAHPSLVVFLSLAAFFATVAREITKDLEDYQNERKISLPKVVGEANAKICALAYAIVAVVFFLLPGVVFDAPDVYAMGAIVGGIFLYSAIPLITGDYRKAQRVMKLGTLLGIVIYLGGVE